MQRVEFLPVQWRTSLTLDEGTTRAITPPGIKLIRDYANDMGLDVLYWTSPRYKQEIIDGFTASANGVVNLYRQRTGFRGPISIFAHSLVGCAAACLALFAEPIRAGDHHHVRGAQEPGGCNRAVLGR